MLFLSKIYTINNLHFYNSNFNFHFKNQTQIEEAIHSTSTSDRLAQHFTQTGIPRNAMRLPEDVTELASERDNNNSKEKEIGVKKSVTKTYHTLKDLISSKFNNAKKDSNEICDELNNVTVMQQHQQDEYRSPYMPVPSRNIAQMNQTPQNTNMWNGRATMDSPLYYHKKFVDHSENYVIQSKAISQPQLNILNYDQIRNAPQRDLNDVNGISHIDATDSDEGGFIALQHRMPAHEDLTISQHRQVPQQQIQMHYHATQKIAHQVVHQPHHLHNNLQNQMQQRMQGTTNNNIKSEAKLDVNKSQEENRANQQQQQNQKHPNFT